MTRPNSARPASARVGPGAFTASAFAATSSGAPASDASSAVPGPDSVATATLGNGLRSFVRENHASPSVVIEGTLFGGALLEPPHAPGTASFAVAMLDRGTEARSFETISDSLEAVGAEIGFGAGRQTTSFRAKCLAEDLRFVLELLAEMFARPAFPTEQVDRVRGQIETALRQRQADTRHRAAVAFRELAYGADHPYGRDIEGTPDGLAAIGRDDLVGFVERAIHPMDGIVALVGDVSASDALTALDDSIGGWSPDRSPPERPRIPGVDGASEIHRADVIVPGKSQADIMLGNPAIPRRHDDWMPAAVANTVLGVFGLMGRLGENVRDRRGLAYYALSRLAGGLGPGPWYAVAGVNPSNVAEAIGATVDEIRRLQDEPVPADELADVKSYITGSLPLQLETNGGVARTLTEIAMYDLGLDYLSRFPALVDAVEAEDVQRAARTHLHPDGLSVAVAGPDVTA